MKSLDQIAMEMQTDRASVFTRTWGKPHDYARHCDKLFTTLRDQPVKLLEIGVGGGEGIKMWLSYFTHPGARVFGVDNQRDTNPYDTPGLIAPYVFTHGDQNSPVFWDQFIKIHGGDFDVVCDDGFHSNISIITTFNALWQHVKPGGFYAVEDLNTAYGGPGMFVNPNWPTHVEFLKGKIDELNKGGGLDSIYFARELCVLRKSLS